jgi:hypothetical protein
MTSRDFSPSIIFNVGGLNYYYLNGIDRANLKKKDIDKLGCMMFLMRIIQFVLIIVVIIEYAKTFKYSDDPTIGIKLIKKLGLIMDLMIISAVLYFIRFVVFLVKKSLRCCCGDDFCRK